jgi:hypothetical protein
MRHQTVAVAVLVAAILAACSEQSLPTERVDRPAAVMASLQYAVGAPVGGTIRTIYAKYAASAPSERVQLALRPGVARIYNSSRQQHLTVDVADSALTRVIGELRALPWVTGIEIAPGNRVHQFGAYHATGLSGAARAIRRTAALPFGVQFTNGALVHTLFGNYGSGVKVGVMDSGIDSANADFGTIYGVNYPADGHSFKYDGTGHGTAVAGVLVGGSTNVVGMAPSVALYSIRVLDYAGVLNSFMSVEMGLDFAIDSGLQVVNISFGDCGYPTDTVPSGVTTALANAVSAGIVVVAAAGDGCGAGGHLSNLATVTGEIAVSSVSSDTTYPGAWVTSNQSGSQVWLAAPDTVLTENLTSTGYWHGTSFAAPHVAGAAALLIHNGKSAGEIKTIFSEEAQFKPDSSQTYLEDHGSLSHDNYVGYGVLDAAAAVVPTPEFVATNKTNCTGTYVFSGQTCTITYTLGSWGGYSPYYVYYTYSDPSSTVDTSTSLTQTFVVPGDGTTSFYLDIEGVAHDTVTRRHVRTGLPADNSYLVCIGTDSLQLNMRTRPLALPYLGLAAIPKPPAAPMLSAPARPRPPKYLGGGEHILDALCP